MTDRDKTISFIPDRLNQEPVIFKGMTNTELFIVIGTSFVFWLVLCVFIGALFGAALVGVGGAVLLTMLSVVLIGNRLQIIKRQLPDGVHTVMFKRWLQQRGILNAGFCLRTGSWDIRRHRRK
ncbi:TIGR03750 family conjugal transfer protein [Endozoicomonas sp. ALC066]|uniref:TIGR03750 family conjugal transfer protein n=1 Tax=Endozoicomonas sp. ALC066 TaxID=3403078 RepID=UPI003BB6EC64